MIYEINCLDVLKRRICGPGRAAGPFLQWKNFIASLPAVIKYVNIIVIKSH